MYKLSYKKSIYIVPVTLWLSNLHSTFYAWNVFTLFEKSPTYM